LESRYINCRKTDETGTEKQGQIREDLCLIFVLLLLRCFMNMERNGAVAAL
jgi:hypothetical protein